MFDNILKIFKKFAKEEKKDSKVVAKERLHLVLMQDRANVSADFMELMKQEIIEVIKKYIDVDENSIDVKLTNKVNNDGTTGAPILYANIPILNVKDDTKQINIDRNVKEETKNNEGAEKGQPNKEENNNVENKTASGENPEKSKSQEIELQTVETEKVNFTEETFENSELNNTKKEENGIIEEQLEKNTTREK